MGDARPLVVVVAFHGADQLTVALDAVTGCDALVVDNSSSPSVLAVARGVGAEYLDSGANLGFAQAVNLGLARAAGRDVVLVNPDAVVSASTVHALVAALHGPGARVAASAPRLVGDDGAEQRVSWPLPTPGLAWRQALGLGLPAGGPRNFLVGAVLALNADAVAEVGTFDPQFFLYAEETDWQRRALDAGWSVELVGGVTATHAGGGSSSDESRREVHFHAGAERYLRKWFGTYGWASTRLATVVGAVPRSVVLPGDRARVARRRAVLMCRGPVAVERPLLPSNGPNGS